MTQSPTYQELLSKCAALEKEVAHLENVIANLRQSQHDKEGDSETVVAEPSPMLSLTPPQKVEIFEKLFVGRKDVFARRWTNISTGKSGYQPVCDNEWIPSLCNKKQFKCHECPHRQFTPLGYMHLFNHLAGKNKSGNDVIGIYPLLADNTCHFLCVDFDDKSCEHGYQEDVTAFVNICNEWCIPASIERSRSGNGAHVWVFFDGPIAASKARKLGNAIMMEAMDRTGRLSFKSFDRFFPNQDSVPEGGFGNLVALPLQGMARKDGNSVFVNGEFKAYDDQWDYLISIVRLSESQADSILRTHRTSMDLSKTSEEKPWEMPTPATIPSHSLPEEISVTLSNGIHIPLQHLPGKLISHLRRMASFSNPEFYKRQNMRLSTYSTPRIISCASLSDDSIILPRGCEDSLRQLFNSHHIQMHMKDETTAGNPIQVSFKGELREEQRAAIESLTSHRNGVLFATTAFGKTVTAIGLIAKLKINTLILVHTQALKEQWVQRINEFLSIEKSAKGIVDVATMQSCLSKGNVKSFVKDYGLVIIDECHHVSAVTFELVMKSVTARYVYGLTATPIRKDGLQPIIFMQCGPIRYKADAKSQLQNQSFKRWLITRFTSFRDCSEEQRAPLQIIKILSEDAYRNKMIVDDVRVVLESGRTPIILSSLKSHVEQLTTFLSPYCKNVITLMGSYPKKKRREIMERLDKIPSDEPLVLIATGKFVGEGFDYARLDTLFIASPVSWRGIVEQYAGRLHREYEGKKDVRIYDYVDIHLPMAEHMYQKRLKGYAAIGYKSFEAGPSLFEPVQESIYNGDNYLPAWIASIRQATKTIVISAPRLFWRHGSPIIEELTQAYRKGIEITMITQSESRQTVELYQKGFNVRITTSHIACTIIDRSTVWYGNVNYLAGNTGEANCIRYIDATLATGLIDMLVGSK
jgi:superfamily II DNA or RNA helicase